MARSPSMALPPKLLAGMTMIVSLAVTWLVWDHERLAARKELQGQFDFALREAVSRVEQRMVAYEQMLRGVQGLAAATGALDRAAFRDYVGALDLGANFAAIQAIGIVEWLPAAGKTAHVAAMRRAGFADYDIRPEGVRDSYAPVIQREPFIGRNGVGLGFDPWSEPVRRRAMEKARDSGTAVISGKLRLAVDTEADAPPGFVMYLPIYTGGKPRDDVAERRTHLSRWVYASFRMRDVMASLYGEQPPGIALAVYDGVEPSEASLLYRTSRAGDPRQPPLIAGTEYLVVAGHTWTLALTAQKDFASRFERNAAPLIAWTGAGLSIALALLAWLMSTGRVRAQRLAEAMTHELRESEQRWAFALEGAGDGVWDWNLRTRVAVTSRRWKEIVGNGGDDGLDAATIDAWEARIHPDDRQRVTVAMRACLAASPDDAASCVEEYRIRCGTGDWKWILSRGMVVERDADGRPLRIIGTITDIGERKATEERIRHMAQHDSLTGLPNRALFSDRVQHELVRASRRDEGFALIFLDLDHFKPINDNYGHAVGDELLKQVARRLAATVRASDTVGRIGGDEFVILVPDLSEPADALALAEKLRQAVRQPFCGDDGELSISCSLGVAIYPDDGVDEIGLSKSADEAMYRAKEAGRDRVVTGKANPEIADITEIASVTASSGSSGVSP